MAHPICIVLVAGHRSIGDKGNDTERQLTDDLARAYKAVFEADPAFAVTWVNPTLTPGGLSGLASASARAIKAGLDAGAKLAVMLDLHFNGRRSGVHAIVPHNLRSDGRGQLSSGFVQGRVADDIAANNTLDVKLAGEIAKEIAAIPGMTLWRAGKSGVPGVMLENETGVGNADGNAPDNARLGMMGATGGLRMSAVRLTVEHGGTDDAQKPDFFNQCAKAAHKAVRAVLADRIDAGEPAPRPDPDEPETPPTGDPEGPSLPAFLFGEAGGYSFDPTGPVSQLWLSTGNRNAAWPRLVDVKIEADTKHFVFADGTVIVAAPGKDVEYLEAAA